MIPLQPGVTGDNPALLVIDIQHFAVDEDAPVPCHVTAENVSGTAEFIDHVNTVVNAAREADIPIIWGKEGHRPDYSDYGAELLSAEITHAMHGTKGFQIHEDLDVDETNLPPAEYIIEKHTYNLFHRTGIEHLLDTYDIDTIIGVGGATNVCVLFTMQGAMERDYVFRVVEECTAGITHDWPRTSDRTQFDAALELLDYLHPGGVQSIDQILTAFEKYDGNEIVKRVKDTGRVYPQEVIAQK